MRFLFYSHDGLGLGHVRRHLAVAAALLDLEPSAKILLATSVDEVSHLGLPPQVDTLKLPGLRKVGNNHYVSRRLGLQTREIQHLRSALLEASARAFQPAVVLVDKHPFGVGGEFIAGLRAAKAGGACAVLGLRDILDSPPAVRAEWFGESAFGEVNDLYSSILVYGERDIFDPVAQYRFPSSLARKTAFCGYVLNPLASYTEEHIRELPNRTASHPTVLGTTGGGEDGVPVIREFIKAATGANWRAIAVAGPQLPETERAGLQEAAAANSNLSLHTFLPSLPALFHKIDALVCMGGYNTLTEATSHGIPTVCVPRTTPRSEQLIRAKLFAERGLVRVLEPEQLNAQRLRMEVNSVLQSSRTELQQRARRCMHFDGARRAAEHLLKCANGIAQPEASSSAGERLMNLSLKIECEERQP